MMIDKAIAKITKEMMKSKDPLSQWIEEYLTGICTTEAVAERLLDPEKNLKAICSEIWTEARSRKDGNCAYIPDEELKGMIRDYYGISEGKHIKKENKIDVLDLL